MTKTLWFITIKAAAAKTTATMAAEVAAAVVAAAVVAAAATTTTTATTKMNTEQKKVSTESRAPESKASRAAEKVYLNLKLQFKSNLS